MDYFKDLYSDCEWIAVQEKSSRSVYRLARNGQPWAYIKIYHPVDLGQKISNRLRPRTASEAHILKDLKAAGFRVPDVIAHHTTGHKSALVTEAIVPGTPLHDIEKSDQREIMLQLATELLKAGYLHRDLHWGNVILDHEQRAYLIDAYEIQKKTIKQKDIIEMFGQVLSIYSVSDRQLKAALKELGHKDLIPAIRRRSHEIARRRSLDMVERCIKPSSFTREISSDEYTALIYQQQEIDLDQTIRRHHQNLKNDENVLKVQDKTQLSIVDSFCVKSYRKPKPATEPYALRAWKGLLSLHFNGIRTAQPVAMLIFNDKSSILINEAVPHPGFDRVLFPRPQNHGCARPPPADRRVRPHHRRHARPRHLPRRPQGLQRAGGRQETRILPGGYRPGQSL